MAFCPKPPHLLQYPHPGGARAIGRRFNPILNRTYRN